MDLCRLCKGTFSSSVHSRSDYESRRAVGPGLRGEEFDVIAIKSRAHFRRGFDDSGFAPTILLVEPPQALHGTVHLNALPYDNLNLNDYYPYGNPSFLKGPA